MLQGFTVKLHVELGGVINGIDVLVVHFRSLSEFILLEEGIFYVTFNDAEVWEFV